MDHQIELIKQKDRKAISEVYKTYREGFILFARRYPLEEDVIMDVYQDAIIALCENAEKGHIDNLSGSLKTYLFSIGKYMIFKKIKDGSRQVDFESVEYAFEWEEYSEEEHNEEVQGLRKSLKKLGCKCREILKLFYYQEKTLDEITKEMGYDNKDVTKSQKSRCLRQLKKLLADE